MFDVLCTGHASFDVTMSVPHHPEADEKMRGEALTLGGGGPAANAAVQVARLGGKGGFCGYIGDDIFGEAHLSELSAEGVDTTFAVRGEQPSPVSQILAKPDGKRSVVNYKADTPWLPSDAINIHTLNKLSPRVLLFDGHEPLLSIPLCEWAKSRGIPTMLDAGSVHYGTRELAGRVDYLLASERFACQYCGLDDPQACLAQLDVIAANVVITLGERGLIWSRTGKTGKLLAHPIESVDSTGAGDSFHGAFALAIVRGMVWEEALRFASAAGALTCTRLGARAALPDSAALSALLTQLG